MVHPRARERLRSEGQGRGRDIAAESGGERTGLGRKGQGAAHPGFRSGKHHWVRIRAGSTAVRFARRVVLSGDEPGARGALLAAACARMGIQSDVAELSGSQSVANGKPSAMGGERRKRNQARRLYAAVAGSGRADDRIFFPARRIRAEQRVPKLAANGNLVPGIAERAFGCFAGNKAKGGGADGIGWDAARENEGAGRVRAEGHTLRSDRTGDRRVAAACGGGGVHAPVRRLQGQGNADVGDVARDWRRKLLRGDQFGARLGDASDASAHGWV